MGFCPAFIWLSAPNLHPSSISAPYSDSPSRTCSSSHARVESPSGFMCSAIMRRPSPGVKGGSTVVVVRLALYTPPPPPPPHLAIRQHSASHLTVQSQHRARPHPIHYNQDIIIHLVYSQTRTRYCMCMTTVGMYYTLSSEGKITSIIRLHLASLYRAVLYSVL